MTKPKKLTPDELDTINKQVQSTLINSAWYVDVKKLLTHIAAVTAERDIATAAVHEIARRWPGESGDRIHVKGTSNQCTIYSPEHLPSTWAVLTMDDVPNV